MKILQFVDEVNGGFDPFEYLHASKSEISSLIIQNVINSVTVVQSLTLAPRDPIRPTRFIDVIGYVNTTDEEVEHFDRVMCEKNGGSEAYQEYIDAKQNFSICIDAVENGIREEFHHIYPGSDISVRKFCAKIPEYEKCMTNFVESVKPCLDASKLETLHLVYNTSHSILQFLCEDDALRIRS